ncbi:MAG TPA: DNA repair protein RecN [Terriglobales bacterium]|nr:DNA repair protein RecN [Terriglobales bacterium]
MLTELRVENYAVIDNVVVQFAPGLNLLTGETGAGKSILIDALALLMGEKASAEVVRHGAEKAILAAVFETDSKAVEAVLEANGLDGNGGELIIRREISVNGKGRVFVNNQPATVQVLKQLAPPLAAIHAQNENVLYFDATARLALLDSYAATDRAAVARGFATWVEIRKRIDDLERDEQDRLRLVDLWSFQRKEIEDAQLQPEEDVKLEAEKRVLANSEKILGAAMGAYDALYDGETSAAVALRGAIKYLEELGRYDLRFAELKAALDSARITVEDAGITLRDYAEGIDASPERLAEVEDRLVVLERLRRKYGRTLEQVVAYGEEVARRLSELENKDELLKHLRIQLANAAADYRKAAHAVSKHRYETARKLEKLVESEVSDLAMKARFRIEVSGSDDEVNWTASGFDAVQYLISANPGEPLGPIENIASGGELSRVMLALKAVVAPGPSGSTRNSKKNSTPKTLIFDEIDTGIGGRAAEAVGRKLKSLAGSNQVICVTHLPQIASFADHHYLIEKHEANGRTRTTVRLLAAKERTEEVARMLSGAKLTQESLQNAESMIKAAGN